MKIKSLVTVLLALAVFGCAQPKPAYRPPAPDFIHTVQYQGETLAAIAKWYTGSSSNWQAIRDVNPGLNPNKIRIGTDIQIPRELLVREAAFPKPQANVQAKKTEQGNPQQDQQQGQENYAAVDPNQGSNGSGQQMPEQYDEGAYSAGDTQGGQNQNDAGDFAINDTAPPTDNSTQPVADANMGNTDFSPPAADLGSAPESSDGKSPVGSFLGALGKAVSDSKKEGEAP